MFIGHAAVALAAKPLAPRVNLAWHLLAAYWLDVVWPVLLLAGMEQVLIAPGITAFTPLNFVYYPWTHSLAAALAWSFIVALSCWRIFGKSPSIVLGFLVFSHWVLDFVTHRPDLPLWPGGTAKVGLGLWNSVPGTIAIEGALFAAAVWFYVRRTPSRDRTGTWTFWSLIAFLSLAYLANAFGPPPPSVNAIAIAGTAGAALFTAWAWWADRHRGVPIPVVLPDWLQRAGPYALGAFVLTVVACGWVFERGLPLAREAVAGRLSPEAEAAIGTQALAVVDEKLCEPSRLGKSMQAGLQREFARLAAGGDGRAYKLHLRYCAGTGPNAFALPGGPVVLSDQLVAQARNFQELLGVLAHELAHTRERHGLRTVLRDAGPLALFGVFRGEANALRALAAALPDAVLQGGYAREFEDAADDYALQRLRKLAVSPRAYADLLERTEIRRQNRGLESNRDYFSTHPLGTRVARVLAAETDLDRCAFASGHREQRLEACTRVIDSGAGADIAAAHMLRGILLNAPGTQARAVEDLGRALSLGSRDARAYNALAWILATSTEDALRDGARARQLALQACELSSWKDASAIDTLAAAHAERREFDDAVRRQKEALTFPDFDGAQGRQARERLALYESAKPHRAPPGQ